MANELQNKLDAILEDKNTNLLPENLKAGITCLGVEGRLETTTEDATSDATLQAKYLMEGYSAVVNGILINGTMKNYGTKTITATSDDIVIPEGHYDSLSIPIIKPVNCADYDICSQELDNI